MQPKLDIQNGYGLVRLFYNFRHDVLNNFELICELELVFEVRFSRRGLHLSIVLSERANSLRQDCFLTFASTELCRYFPHSFRFR